MTRPSLVRKYVSAGVVKRVMRWVLLLVVLAVLVFLGNLMWTTFFGGRSLF